MSTFRIHFLSDRQRLALFCVLGALVGAAIDLAGRSIEGGLRSGSLAGMADLRLTPTDLVSTLFAALAAAAVGLHIASRWNRELRMEVELRNSWRNLATVIGQSPFAQIVTDQQGVVLSSNATARQFFPDSTGLAEGRPFALFDPAPGETSIRIHDAGPRFFRAFSTSIQWDGRPARLLSLLDITKQKELEQLREDVDRIARHDLKGPLNGIIGLPQALAMDGNLTEEQLDMLRLIEKSGRKMLNMIDLSLDLFKMETGTYSYAPVRVDAATAVRQVIEELQPMLTARNVAVEATLDGSPLAPGSAFPLPAEERLLQAMLSNLLLNAVEASPPGGTVAVEMTTPGRPVLAIRNRGAASASIRERFFEKYQTCGKPAGTGLGTYSAKLMADVMGFEIGMEASDAEDSTRVWLAAPTHSGW